MTRFEFTKNICSLIIEMIDMGERPLLDYIKRSDAEQRRLFDQGLSKCDGVNSISQHQRGRAADIYFLSEDGSRLVRPNMGDDYWHELWVRKYDGEPMIIWDRGHFE